MTQILGLTCISEELKDKDKKKYSFQTMTRKRFNDLCVRESRDEAVKQLSERILHNVIVTQYIINHCHSSNIGHYRLSSALFLSSPIRLWKYLLKIYPTAFQLKKN